MHIFFFGVWVATSNKQTHKGSRKRSYKMEPVHEIFILHASNSKKVTKVEPVHEPPILHEKKQKKGWNAENSSGIEQWKYVYHLEIKPIHLADYSGRNILRHFTNRPTKGPEKRENKWKLFMNSSYSMNGSKIQQER